MINRLALLALNCLALAATAAPLELRWRAEASNPQPYAATIYHGETITLAATLTAYNAPIELADGSTCTLYYQTNGMAATWWEASGTIADSTLRATWTPAQDIGAPLYTFFLAATTPGGRLYRAHGTLSMRASPGFTPAVLPEPDIYPDFAAALWPYLAPLSSAAWGPRLDLIEQRTNAWDTAYSYGPHADLYLNLPVWQTWLSTNTLASTTYVDEAISAIPEPLTDRIITPDGMEWIDAHGDIWHGVVELVADTNICVVADIWDDESQIRPPILGSRFIRTDTGTYTNTLGALTHGGGTPFRFYQDESTGDFIFEGSYNGSMVGLLTDPIPPGHGWLVAPYGGVQFNQRAMEIFLSWLPKTNIVGVKADRISTTNQLIAATNALIETYFLGTNAYLIVSNDTLRIQREIGGITNLLWSSTGSASPGIDPVATQQLWQAIGQLQSALAAVDPAWGKRAPDGSLNPDPNYMTYLNAPATMHASGYQWASSGAYYVLAQSGAVAFDSGTDGAARWGLDLTDNYIGFERGGSIIVGARSGGISIDSQAQTASIIFDFTGGDWPVLMFAPSLADGLAGFVEQDGVAWVDNGDGTATVTAPATTPGGFWYASSSYSTESIFVAKPPVRLDGGIFGATNALPVRYDSTITISTGAGTYRIPAQKED